MAEPNEIDDILERFKRRAESANKEPTRDLTPEEVANSLRQMFKLCAALQGECEILNAKIKRLEGHHHVTGDAIVGLMVQPAPTEILDDESKEPDTDD